MKHDAVWEIWTLYSQGSQNVFFHLSKFNLTTPRSMAILAAFKFSIILEVREMFFMSNCYETQGPSCRHLLRLFSIYVSINKHNSYKKIPDVSREWKVGYSRAKP